MNNKFAIGIPTLNRFDLLQPALLFYKIDFPDIKIFVVDNGNQNIQDKISNENITVVENDKNVGVAASWNQLCRLIYKEHDNALILNDDIYLGRKQWEVINLIDSFKKDFFVSTQDWCAFLLPKATFESVGEFDEEFTPAYYEDNDYKYRLKLNGNSIFEIPFLNPFVYRVSKTVERNPALKSLLGKNSIRYENKWGGKPKSEKYKRPFNI